MNNGITAETKKKHRREDNLIPYKKGQSGNPAGRKPGTISVITVVKNVLQEMAKTTDGTKKQRLETLARNIVHLAINERDKDMIKLIVNYVDGMPKQTTELTGQDGEPICIKWEQ